MEHNETEPRGCTQHIAEMQLFFFVFLFFPFLGGILQISCLSGLRQNIWTYPANHLLCIRQDPQVSSDNVRSVDINVFQIWQRDSPPFFSL